MHQWLAKIELAEYQRNFAEKDIKTVRDLEALKPFDETYIKEKFEIQNKGAILAFQVI